MGVYYGGGGSHGTQDPPSYRVWGGGGGASTRPCPTYNQMHAGFSFSYLRFAEAASFDKKSYVGAVHSLSSSKGILRPLKSRILARNLGLKPIVLS